MGEGTLARKRGQDDTGFGFDMLWTLHGYIFREMGKTFALTAVGLTALIGLGGGVVNMVGFEGVGLLDLFHMQQLILPVALAISLPIAALFSATVTYGRLSAENEFVACKASGINVHRLMFSALLISLFASGVGFLCFNYILPNTMRNIDELFRTNFEQIVKHMINSPKRLPMMGEKYHLYADSAASVNEDDMTYIHLEGIVFSELDDGEWQRYGTSDSVDLEINLTGTVPVIGATMHGLRWYDRDRQQFIEEEYQVVQPTPIDPDRTIKLKWLNLTELLDYSKHPWDLPEIHLALTRFRKQIGWTLFYRDLVAKRQMSPNAPIVLGDDETRIELEFDKAEPAISDKKAILRLLGNVRVTETLPDQKRVLIAPGADVWVSPGWKEYPDLVHILLTNGVTIESSRDPGELLERSDEDLATFALPAEFVEKAQTWDSRYLLSPNANLELGELMDIQQAKLVDQYGTLTRKLMKEIHSRLALSSSWFLLVILGAALGIAFRGSHALTAFGISAVPTILVVVIIIMGRQLSKDAGTAAIGLGVIWLGVALVIVLNAIALTKLVRR